MRCPKCQYISFDSGRRCRNCGYDFSLSAPPESMDLPIHDAHEPFGPLTDLPLAQDGLQASADQPATSSPARAASIDLPLFPGAAEDAPLVVPPSVPRAPLSVRRGAPPVAAKPRPRAPLDEGPELDLIPPAARPPASAAAPGAESAPGVAGEPRLTPASAVARIAAGLVDVIIMGSIDLAVVYLTLRVSELPFQDVMALPKIPLLAFLLLLNGGYLVLFTAAGGQTIGKMASGIRVVPEGGSSPVARVPFGSSVVRAAAYAASLLPAGLGFLPILFNADGRTIHDRLSDTRVVKA